MAAREDRTSESQTQESAQSAGKPIVKLVDVTKIYVMGHAGEAAACSAAAEPASRP